MAEFTYPSIEGPTLGTYHRTREALGDLILLDRLGRPQRLSPDYLSLMAGPHPARVKAALDLWSESEAREAQFWGAFRERLAKIFKTEIQSRVSIPIKPKYQPALGPLLSHQAADLTRRLEMGDLSAEALLPKAAKRPTARFPTIADLKWEEVTITFISKDSVRITARDVTKVFTFSEMGFTDRRKGDLPDQRWVFLRVLAIHHGQIDARTSLKQDMKRTATKAVSVIRDRLKVLLGIGTDPFHSYRQAKGYRTRFALRNEAHDQDDGRSWDE